MCEQAFTELIAVNVIRFHFDGLCCHVLYQIVTEQQLAQKVQIVTAIDQAGAGKQQFILANLDYPNQEKLFIKQENSPAKVILTSADGSAVNQLLFASPELTGQQIQVNISALSRRTVHFVISIDLFSWPTRWQHWAEALFHS